MFGPVLGLCQLRKGGRQGAEMVAASPLLSKTPPPAIPFTAEAWCLGTSTLATQRSRHSTTSSRSVGTTAMRTLSRADPSSPGPAVWLRRGSSPHVPMCKSCPRGAGGTRHHKLHHGSCPHCRSGGTKNNRKRLEPSPWVEGAALPCESSPVPVVLWTLAFGGVNLQTWDGFCRSSSQREGSGNRLWDVSGWHWCLPWSMNWDWLNLTLVGAAHERLGQPSGKKQGDSPECRFHKSGMLHLACK